MLLAGGCVLAADAVMVWIGVWVWEQDVLFPEYPEWFSPLFRIALRAAPAVALAAAGVEMMRGSLGWARAAVVLILTVSSMVTTFAAAAAAVLAPAGVVLLVLVGFAYVRLLRLAPGPDVH